MGEILRDVNVEERRAARMMMGLGSGQKVNPACSSGGSVQSLVGRTFHKGGAARPLLALPQAVRVGYFPKKATFEGLREG